MKKLSILFVMILVMLSACTPAESIILQEPEQSEVVTTQEEITQEPEETILEFSNLVAFSADRIADYNHGQIGYLFLEHIQEHFPGRIAFTEQELNAANWLIAELLYAGYSMDDIEIQEFRGTQRALDWARNFTINAPEGFDGLARREYSQNVIVTKHGESDKVIIVGAHYDDIGLHGISDNASGMVMLLESAIRMLNVETPYTIKFIFFGAEEVGLIGAYHYVDSLTEEEKANILFMLNIDVIFESDDFHVSTGTLLPTGEFLNPDPISDRIDEMVINSDLDLILLEKDMGVANIPSDQLPFVFEGITAVVFDAVRREPNGGLGFDFLHDFERDSLPFIHEYAPERIERALFSFSVLLEQILLERF